MQMDTPVNEPVTQDEVIKRLKKRIEQLERTNIATAHVANQAVYAAITVMKDHGRWSAYDLDAAQLWGFVQQLSSLAAASNLSSGSIVPKDCESPESKCSLALQACLKNSRQDRHPGRARAAEAVHESNGHLGPHRLQHGIPHVTADPYPVDRYSTWAAVTDLTLRFAAMELYTTAGCMQGMSQLNSKHLSL
jgi:hypothetical protein